MVSTEWINNAVSPFGINITAKQGELFNTYSNFLVEYNEKVNLTAITGPNEIAVKHFADSIAPLALFELPKDCSVIDVGTGAGFPGVPMKILRPDIRLTLLDSLNKRLEFLRQLSDQLSQRGDRRPAVYRRNARLYFSHGGGSGNLQRNKTRLVVVVTASRYYCNGRYFYFQPSI